ncbi:MAG: lipid-transfer protein [Deltaproteobacteria bacterium]|nr:lipid-transfer protein [Deltaproteobacteria bacterium]
MNKNKVIIAGVGMIPFKKPGKSETYDVMGAQAAQAALKDAGIEYKQVQRAIASYVYGDTCSGQAALYHVGITGIPVVNVSTACASGSTAFALATDAVKSGAVDCALAVGFEQMVPGALDMIFPDKPCPQDRHIAAIAQLSYLSDEELKTPVAILMFGCQTDLLKERYGISDRALARVAVKARRHAAGNPNAIFRDPITEEDILAMPPIFRSLRKFYACPPSCGAAAVIVCNEEFAAKNAICRDISVAGQGWVSDRQNYFEGDPLDIMLRGLVRDSANLAYEEAGLGPDDVDVIELHDCFTSNEIVNYSGLGLCKEEDLERFVMEDRNTYGGQVVVNPSGGLLSKGHPLGATGLAQITELTWQLRGQAGPRQVEGARIALQQNAGVGSTYCVNIFQRQ